VADVNRSGTLTQTDATLVSQEAQYLTTGNAAFDRQEIPSIPAGLAPLNFRAATFANGPAGDPIVPAKAVTTTTPNALIDLSGKLATFSLDTTSEADASIWKKQLAGSTVQAATVNPNSKLSIPVTPAASKSAVQQI
jgi:hypothetical protein